MEEMSNWWILLRPLDSLQDHRVVMEQQAADRVWPTNES